VSASAPPSFASLCRRFPTTPIAGCPGRHLIHGEERTSVAALVGDAIPVGQYVSRHARDPVFVARIPGGGLISYAKPDGSFVHTLCDDEGFARKLAQLGIEHS